MLRGTAPGSASRARLETFIRDSFRAHFGARVEAFLPLLAGLYGPDDTLHAAVGLRAADAGPLFLETYLDAPIEQVIASHFRRPVARDSIAEVGNLAAARPGVARLFFQALTLGLAASGVQWVVFTGTRRVLACFRRLGLCVEPLGVADPARLGAAAQSWGSYYAHGPQVAAGFVPDGLGELDAGLFDGPELETLMGLVRRPIP